MATNLDKVKIGNKIFYSMPLFMEMNGIKGRPTVYAWVKADKAKMIKIGSNSFFTKA